MIRLFYFLHDELSKVNEKVYNRQKIPIDANYPFITYNISSQSPQNEFTEALSIEVDVWHRKKSGIDSLAQIEDITRRIKEHFQEKVYIDDEKSVTFRQPIINPIPDTNPDLRRRQLRYNVNVDWR